MLIGALMMMIKRLAVLYQRCARHILPTASAKQRYMAVAHLSYERSLAADAVHGVSSQAQVMNLVFRLGINLDVFMRKIFFLK